MKTEKPRKLLPEKIVKERYGVGDLTLWKWDQDPKLLALGWPPPAYIRNRKYRDERRLDIFDDNLIENALVNRRKGKVPPEFAKVRAKA